MSEAMSNINVRYDKPLLFSIDKTLILRTDRSVSFCIGNWTGYTLRNLSIQLVTIPLSRVLHEHIIDENIENETIYCDAVPNLSISDGYRGEAFYRLVGRADPGNIPVEVPIRVFIDSGSVAFSSDKRVFTFGYFKGNLYMRVDNNAYHLVDDLQFAIYEREDGTSAIRVPSKDMSYKPLDFQPDMTYVIDIAHKYPDKRSLAKALFAANPFLVSYVNFKAIRTEEDAEKVIKLVMPFVLEDVVKSFYIPVVKVDLEQNLLIEEYVITVKGLLQYLPIIMGALVIAAVIYIGYHAVMGFARGVEERMYRFAAGASQPYIIQQMEQRRDRDLNSIENSIYKVQEFSLYAAMKILDEIDPSALRRPKEEIRAELLKAYEQARGDVKINFESRRAEKIQAPPPGGPGILDIALIGMAGIGVGLLLSQYLSRDKGKQEQQ